MENSLRYKEYMGSVEWSEEDGVWFGRVQSVRALISYDGETIKDLIEDFRGAVDDYLEVCRAYDIVPEKSFDLQADGAVEDAELEKYMAHPYRLELRADGKDGGYVAFYPDLPGCFTCGETMQEVQQNAQDAKREWITAALTMGFSIKEPTERV